MYLMLQPLLITLTLDKCIRKGSFDISLSGIYQGKSIIKNVKSIFFWNCLHQYKQLLEKKIVIKVCVACVPNYKQT